MNDSNVKQTYELIAENFSSTRYNVWPCVKDFLDQIKKNSILVDIGCGNGKNMMYRKDCINFGCDFSESLVKICHKKNLNVSLGNILNLPFKDNFSDNTICIAVIHHLDNLIKRKKAIDELLRITKPGGQILILVWAYEQEINSKRKFTVQENLIEWKNNTQNIIGKRYYYVFKKDELKELVDINLVKKVFYEKGNWGIIIKKN